MKRFALSILGAGRMGHAIASSLVSRGVFPPRKICLADVSSPARRRAAALGCRTVIDVLDAADPSEIVLIAVKPRKIEDVARRIRPAVRGKRVISILAGTTRARLARLLPGARVIRIMPNTPLLAASGAIVIARDGVSSSDLMFVSRMFSGMGRVWSAPEKWMNAVTAISGSGPALFCAFLESCVAAGAAAGLPAKFAESLAVQTLAGTAALLNATSSSRLSARSLREMVTSPGGTTEAALEVFCRRGLNRLVREAVRAAVRRGIKLSR